MSVSALRVVVALVLIGHGLGHALPILPAFGFTLSPSHSNASWLLPRTVGPVAVGLFCTILHLLALSIFIAAGLALAGWGLSSGSWEKLAVPAAVLSLVGLGIFLNGYPFLVPNKVGVLLVDGFVLASVLWLRWPVGLFD